MLLEEMYTMANESGMIGSEYTTTLLTFILAHVVDTLILHPEIPNVTGLSQRLLEEWYDGEMTPLGKGTMSRRLAEAATGIAKAGYRVARVEEIRRCAKAFSADFHLL
jgi:hypothetical protein